MFYSFANQFIFLFRNIFIFAFIFLVLKVIIVRIRAGLGCLLGLDELDISPSGIP